MLFPIISTRIHGILDYVVAAIFIVLPWIVGFSNYMYGPWIMMIVGVLNIIYSVMTRYELGYTGLISMRTHLLFDLILGAFLLSSPWLLNFEHRLISPHIIGGSVMIITSLCTQVNAGKKPDTKLYPDNGG